MDRDLHEDVRRGAESVEPDPACVAGRPVCTVPDETRAEQRRRFRIAIAVREFEHEAPVGDGVVGITAIDLITGEARVEAKILAVALAVLALFARVAEPRNADPVADREVGDAVAEPLDDADDFMARHERNFRVQQLAVDHVQVGSAHAAGPYADQHLAGQRNRQFTRARLERTRTRAGEHHGSHGKSKYLRM